MHTGPRRTAGLLLAVAMTILTVVSTAQSATASPRAAEGETQQCVIPKTTADDTISIIGQICDTRETPPTGVEGVSISVEDDGGNPVGEATTASDGTFEIPLPGTSIDNLGKTFTVKIDEESMPEGAALRNPDDVTRPVKINLDNDVSVTFPVGEATVGQGWATQGLQLFVGGIVFSVLLAMAALGLSMIFGTTGL
ncbi:MAG: hypothetical protein ACRDPR_14425, partial [Nocardioidaceae bacterium]